MTKLWGMVGRRRTPTDTKPATPNHPTWPAAPARPTSTRSSPTTSAPPESYAAGPKKTRPEPWKGSSANGSPKPASPPSNGPTKGTATASSTPTKSSPSPSPSTFPWCGSSSPPRDHRTLHHTTNIVSELYGIVFGREDQLEPVYDRLRQLGIDEPTQVDRTIENLTGRPSPARQTSYRERRKQLLLALLDQYTDDVDRAAEEIGTFFDHLRQVGIRGLVAEQTQRR